MCKICLGSESDNNWNDHINQIEREFDFDSIGKSYKTNESDLLHFMSIPSVQKHRVINLYKYEPLPGEPPIIENTRRFCSQLYLRTQSKDNYMTYSEIQSLSNPGGPYGVSDTLYYRGNFSTDSKYQNCRHRFIRFKYDTETGNIVRDTSQPLHS